MVNYLLTGGAGSLGRRLTEELLRPSYGATAIRVLDNHENSIANLRSKLVDPRLRWLLGDVRDKERMLRAMENIDVCFHLAAQKHVDLGEYNPSESLKTNVIGTQNCIDAALENNVDKFVTFSSDKAVLACSTYGRCKALAESLTLDAENYKGDRRTKFSVIRPPNYIRSDGSVFELWDYQKNHGQPITVTDERMERYFMSFEEIIEFIVKAVRFMRGGEIFVPTDAKKYKIIDLAKEYAKDGKVEIIGIRRGEKLEEVLMDPSEQERAIKWDGLWVIQ